MDHNFSKVFVVGIVNSILSLKSPKINFKNRCVVIFRKKPPLLIELSANSHVEINSFPKDMQIAMIYYHHIQNSFHISYVCMCLQATCSCYCWSWSIFYSTNLPIIYLDVVLLKTTVEISEEKSRLVWRNSIVILERQ